MGQAGRLENIWSVMRGWMLSLLPGLLIPGNVSKEFAGQSIGSLLLRWEGRMRSSSWMTPISIWPLRELFGAVLERPDNDVLQPAESLSIKKYIRNLQRGSKLLPPVDRKSVV